MCGSFLTGTLFAKRKNMALYGIKKPLNVTMICLAGENYVNGNYYSLSHSE